MATLNALARYAGFEGWRDAAKSAASADGGKSLAPENFDGAASPRSASSVPFAELGHTKGIVPNSQPPTITQSTPAPPQPAPRQKRSTTPIIIATIALAVLLSLLSARLILPNKTTAPLRFEARRSSDQLPNSVVFDYDVGSLHPHSVIIQQSWDTRRRDSVPPDGHQHTSIYYYPGYFRARLIVDGGIKKQAGVFIPSKGWKGIVEHEPLPVYLRPDEIKQDSGYMGISSATLRKTTGSGIFSNCWVEFANVREFPGITGDQFTLEATVRNTSTVEECLCRKVQITLLGKLSAIIIPLCDKGCIADIGLLPGFEGISGKDHDLSAFGCDFPHWQQLKCRVADHHFEIQLNGRTIFVKEKALSIGDIMGVCVTFEGTGEVKDLYLQGRGERVDVLTQ